jgi:23S rRNA (pseudouridine1915-N3)-methyltransferase
MGIRLISVQSSKNSWLDEASRELSEKIGHFAKFELHMLKSSKKGREDAQSKRIDESELILKSLKDDDYVILFDEKGQGLQSRQFAELIEKLQTSGAKRLTFVIGGAFGVSDALKKRAQKTLKMSDFVLNHHVALVVALEQIYRAYSIINNKHYHND